MRDLALIASALAECEALGEPSVLATIVRTEGSTYRRAGARMLLRASGRTTGAVSGGCLEADLAARVDDLLAAGRAEVVTCDTRTADDLVWASVSGAMDVWTCCSSHSPAMRSPGPARSTRAAAISRRPPC